jgi:hypothetical protein
MCIFRRRRYNNIALTAGLACFSGNYTGPYNIPICFDATNDGMMSGFNIDYLLLPC